jgi:DnaD/phage-associated family protein
MKCKFNMELWNGIFAVPTAIVDNYIRLAGGAQLKVILWLLRNNGQEPEPEQLSVQLGLSIPDTIDAIYYWVEKEMLTVDDNELQNDTQHLSVVPITKADEELSSYIKEVKTINIEENTKKNILPSQIPHYSSNEIAKRTAENPDIKYLLNDAQVKLGKTISPSEASTLTALNDWLGHPVDVILMIISYCITIGKPNMRYIEKVALSWADEGINTHEKAEEYILSIEKNRSIESQIKKLMGLGQRSLTSSEEANIKRWTNDWQFDIEMITLAYERAVDKTGTISFPYINSILRSWHQNGMKTTLQANAEKIAHKKQTVIKSTPSYDLDEYERALINESPRLLK